MADSLRASLSRREVLTERDDDQHVAVSPRRCAVPPTGRSGRRPPVALTLSSGEAAEFKQETIDNLWRRFAQLALAHFGCGWMWRLAGTESVDERCRLTVMREHKRTVG